MDTAHPGHRTRVDGNAAGGVLLEVFGREMTAARAACAHCDREAELGRRLARGVTEIDGVHLLGPEPGVERVGLVSIDVAGVHAHDVGQLLDVAGIAVRVGHHCAQPLHRELGLTASTRASTYVYNTTDDVDHFLDELSRVRGYFRAEGA